MWAVVKSLLVSLAVDLIRDWRRDRGLIRLGYAEAERDAAKRASKNRQARQNADRAVRDGNAIKRLRDGWSRD